MKLTPLTASTFEAMSKDAMRYIVGGEACATPGDTITRGDQTIKYSADTKDGPSTTYNVTTDKSTAECPCTTTAPSTAK
jgi:hypothetical protein